MELRLRSRARATKDLDLGCTTPEELQGGIDPVSKVRELLQEAAARDLGDHLVYRVGAPRGRIDAAAEGGARYPVLVALAGREYGSFHVDVGLGPGLDAEPERSFGERPARVRGCGSSRDPARPAREPVRREAARLHPAVGRSREHANEGPRRSVAPDRARAPEPDSPHRAVRGSFADRAGGRPPATLPRPPQSWSATYAHMAEEVGLSQLDLDSAFECLAAFCTEAKLGRPAAGD